jgi:hypothetical protein
MVQKRIDQAFPAGGIAGTLEAKALQVRSAFPLVDIRNGRPPVTWSRTSRLP